MLGVGDGVQGQNHWSPAGTESIGVLQECPWSLKNQLDFRSDRLRWRSVFAGSEPLELCRERESICVDKIVSILYQACSDT